MRPVVFFVDESMRAHYEARLDEAEALIRERLQQLGEQIDRDKAAAVDNSLHSPAK